MNNLSLGMSIKAIRTASVFLIDDVFEAPEFLIECAGSSCRISVDIVEETLPTWKLVDQRVLDVSTNSPFTAYIGGHVIQAVEEYHKTDIPGDFVDALLLTLDDGGRVFMAAQQGAEEPQVGLTFKSERIVSRLRYYSRVD
jgi:hypothetical protein